MTRRVWTPFLALALALTASARPAAAQQPQPDLKKIRVLLVLDTNTNLKNSVLMNRDLVLEVFKKGMPASLYEITELKGDDVTPAKVIDYYNNIQTSRDECLFFYYNGHGATFKDHVLTMQAGIKGKEPMFLKRQTLLNVMRLKNPGLIVVLTNSCAD